MKKVSSASECWASIASQVRERSLAAFLRYVSFSFGSDSLMALEGGGGGREGIMAQFSAP